MRLQLNLLPKRRDEERRAPSHLFGGRVRTSTVVLLVAFLALWWTYNTYGPQDQVHTPSTPSQVVPPGYVPDPDYTWVPRTRVEQPLRTPTPTPTPTPTTTTPPAPTTTSPSSTPGPLPCLLPPPFCAPSSSPSPTPSSPQPGPGPGASLTPPAR